MTKSLTNSQMSMWKAVVSLIHADGVQHPDEVKFIVDRLDKLRGTSEQKKEILSVINDSSTVEDHFSQITSPGDRSQFIYFARLLFWSDGDFNSQEKKLHEHLHDQVIDKVAMREIMKELDKAEDKITEWQARYKESQPLHRKVLNALIFWDDLDVAD